MATSFMLGQHEAILERLEEGQREIFNRLGTIESTLAERRGERRVGSFLWGSFSGVIGGVVVFATKAWLATHGAQS